MSLLQFAILLAFNVANLALALYAVRQRNAQYELAKRLHKERMKVAKLKRKKS